MILVDTSVWIDHLRQGDPHLTTLLERNQVAMHPWIVGELSCGNLRNRAELLKRLQGLPQLSVARDREVLYFIESWRLMGTGIGYVDAHLATAALAAGVTFWTRDKRLVDALAAVGVLYAEPPRG